MPKIPHEIKNGSLRTSQFYITQIEYNYMSSPSKFHYYYKVDILKLMIPIVSSLKFHYYYKVDLLKLTIPIGSISYILYTSSIPFTTPGWACHFEQIVPLPSLPPKLKD